MHEHSGVLILREDGRYGLKDGYYWTCGDYMEIWDYNISLWRIGRVEHDNVGYYWTDGESFKRLDCSTIARA